MPIRWTRSLRPQPPTWLRRTRRDTDAPAPAKRRGAGLLRRAYAPQLFPSEGGTAAAGAEAVEQVPGSLAALLTRHVLRDGELVLLILRPSLWYILLTGLKFIAAVAILMTAGMVWDDRVPGSARIHTEIGIFFIAGRLTWALCQWMGRIYVLTDMRIVAVSGVFSPQVFECPLRKVARTRLVYTVRERLLGLGSLEIIPHDEESPAGMWQTIARPRKVHERVLTAIRRARQGGMGQCDD